MNLITRRCPRCIGGQMSVGRDHYGVTETCIQCGYSSDIETIPHDVRREMIRDDGSSKIRRRMPTMSSFTARVQA